MTLEALTAMSAKIYGFIKPVITSELGKEIAGDFKVATMNTMRELWQKIRPLFIVEDADGEELIDLKANPEDPIAEDNFKSKLKAKLSKDANLREEIEKLLAELEKAEDPAAKVVISGGKNINAGNISGVAGNVQIGDVINNPPKN